MPSGDIKALRKVIADHLGRVFGPESVAELRAAIERGPKALPKDFGWPEILSGDVREKVLSDSGQRVSVHAPVRFQGDREYDPTKFNLPREYQGLKDATSASSARENFQNWAAKDGPIVTDVSARRLQPDLINRVQDPRGLDEIKNMVDFVLLHQPALAEEAATGYNPLGNQLPFLKSRVGSYLKNLDFVKNGLERAVEYPVVFETGKPITFTGYHSSPYGRLKGDAFDPTMLGRNTEAGSASLAHFFAGDPRTAASEEYLTKYMTAGRFPPQGMLDAMKEPRGQDKLRQIAGDIYQQIADETGQTPWWNAGSYSYAAAKDPVGFQRRFEQVFGYPLNNRRAAPRTHEVYITAENPFVHDYNGEHYREEKYYDLLKKAKDGGHDVAIFTNTFDGGPRDNIFAVLKGNEGQIKSTQNTGVFSRLDPNIYRAALPLAAGGLAGALSPKDAAAQDFLSHVYDPGKAAKLPRLDGPSRTEALQDAYSPADMLVAGVTGGGLAGALLDPAIAYGLEHFWPTEDEKRQMRANYRPEQR